GRGTTQGSGGPPPPVPRLLAALGGHTGDGSTLVLATGTKTDEMALAVLLDGWARAHRPRGLALGARATPRGVRAGRPVRPGAPGVAPPARGPPPAARRPRPAQSRRRGRRGRDAAAGA